jgi:hypothetical protein
VCHDPETGRNFELVRFVDAGVIPSVSSSAGTTDFEDGRFDIQDDAGSYEGMHEAEETIAGMLMIG